MMCIGQNVHSKQMYICPMRIKTNVHSKRMYICTKWLLHCGHVCHILSMIAALWPCLPYILYGCHTMAIFVTFWVWLPQCVNVCYVLSTFATLSHCLPCFVYDWHFVSMFVMFCVWLPYCSHVFRCVSISMSRCVCASRLFVNSKPIKPAYFSNYEVFFE